MAEDRTRWTSAFARRALYFDRELVSVHGGVSASGVAGGECFLERSTGAVDFGQGLARRRRDGRSRGGRVRYPSTVKSTQSIRNRYFRSGLRYCALTASTCIDLDG